MKFEFLEESITVITYPTFQEVLFLFWRESLQGSNIPKEDLTWDDFLKSEIESQDELGDSIILLGKDFIEQLEAQNLWGFCDTQENTIHVWDNGSDPFEDILFLVSHEIGHISSKYLLNQTIHKGEGQDNLIGEIRANIFAETTSTAYSISKWIRPS